MSVLNRQVSYFKNPLDAANPATINLMSFLRSDRHLKTVKAIRDEPDKARRDEMKKTLPGITPSGVFSYRNEAGLISHSGLICLDIDFDKNPYNPESLKAAIARIKNVAYCGLSVSGRGVWALVPIGLPERHKDHYQSIVTDFAGFGITLDPAPANVASFRYYSYDQDAYINESAEPYFKLPEPKPERNSWTSTHTGESLAARAARYLIDTRATVAYQYDDYLRTCAACKDAFGDEGQDVAWSILENSPAFQVSNFRKDFAAHWHSLKRAGGNVATGGTLVYLAEQHGFDKRTGSAWYHTPAPTLPAPRKEPDAAIWQTVTMHGQTFDVQVTPEGYPVMWDEPTPPPAVTIPARDCSTPPNPPAIDTRGLTDRERRAIAAAVKTNSKTADLVSRFEMELVGVTALHN